MLRSIDVPSRTQICTNQLDSKYGAIRVFVHVESYSRTINDRRERTRPNRTNAFRHICHSKIAHNASNNEPMQSPCHETSSTVHTSVKRKKRTNNREQYPRTCNAVDAATMQFPPQLSREVCTSKGGNQKPQDEDARNRDNQSRPLLGPRTKRPVRPFCANPKTRPPIPEENPQIQKSTKNCRFTRTSQVACKSSIVQHTEESSSVDSNTLRDLVCCGSVLVCPCCRHGHWSCARSSCPRYCVG